MSFDIGIYQWNHHHNQEDEKISKTSSNQEVQLINCNIYSHTGSFIWDWAGMMLQSRRCWAGKHKDAYSRALGLMVEPLLPPRPPVLPAGVHTPIEVSDLINALQRVGGHFPRKDVCWKDVCWKDGMKHLRTRDIGDIHWVSSEQQTLELSLRLLVSERM